MAEPIPPRSSMRSVSALLAAALMASGPSARAAGDVETMKVVGVRPDDREMAIRCLRETWGDGDDVETHVSVVRVDTRTGRILSTHPIARPGGQAGPPRVTWAALSKTLRDEGFTVQTDAKADLVPLTPARRVDAPAPQTTWLAAVPIGKTGASATLVLSFVPYTASDPESDDSWNVAVDVTTSDGDGDFFSVGRIEGDSSEVCPNGSADSKFSIGASPFKGFAVIERVLEGGEGRSEHDYYLVAIDRSAEGRWVGRLVPLRCG